MARRTAAQVGIEIEKLASDRQKLWFGDRPGTPGEATRISNQLADLYEERRALVAGGDRDTIVKRARVETELERLMSS